ncbi:MAG: class I SAM-dependent methyltransferase [Candidatus Absconditicoccaceae bacterium]
MKLFKKESLITKLYLCFRIIIFPVKFLTRLTGLIKDNDRVLDLGCGYGIISLYLIFAGYKNKIFGLDIDKKRIQNLNNISKINHFNELRFEIRDFINQGFDGLDLYNVAILVDFLHHIDKDTQESLLKNLSKYIDKIIIKDIDRYPKYKYYWNIFHDKIIMQNKILCFQGSSKIHKYLVSLGYKVTYQKIPSIFPYPHFLLIAEK